MENGDRIWSLTIHSKDEYAIGLEYSNFFLPDGSNLYLLNNNHSIIHGAFTSDNNQEDMLFSYTSSLT